MEGSNIFLNRSQLQIQSQREALLSKNFYTKDDMSFLRTNGFDVSGPRLPTGGMHRIDAVDQISFSTPSTEVKGLAQLKGYAIGYLDISDNNPIWDEHFEGDSVLPGSFMTEGLSQMLGFYLSRYEATAGLVESPTWLDRSSDRGFTSNNLMLSSHVPRLNQDRGNVYLRAVPRSVGRIYYLIKVLKIEDQTQKGRFIKGVADGVTYYIENEVTYPCVQSDGIELSLFKKSFYKRLVQRRPKIALSLTEQIEVLREGGGP